MRHVDEDNPDRVGALVAELTPGQLLDLADEPDNPANPSAIVLKAAGRRVGSIPDYLLDYVHKQRGAGKRVTAVVVQPNGPEMAPASALPARGVR